MSSDIRKEHNGHKLIKHCKTHGAVVRRGRGDHVIVRYHNTIEVIPDRPLGHGLQCKIIKWMVQVGLAVILIALIKAIV